MHSLAIVGAGPGGLAPLFAAVRHGKLQPLLDAGILLIDQGSSVGAGQLADYSISSDSPAEAFLDSIEHCDVAELRELLQHESAQELSALRGRAVPLTLAARFLAVAAQRLCAMVERSPRCRVVTSHQVDSVQQCGAHWEVVAVDRETGARHTFCAISVHLATGAHQPKDRLHRETVGSAPLVPRFSDKVIQSGELFGPHGMAMLAERLGDTPTPRVVIVGGSTSAGAAAVHLLRKTSIPFGDGGVTLLHRSPLRLFYASPEEARADGYSDFRAEDVCRLSGRVYRLSGFRFESKDLLRNALVTQACVPDPRLKLLSLTEDVQAAEQALEEADVIIAAMGYRPRMATIVNQNGKRIQLHTPVRGDWAMVDQQCRVLTAEGKSLDGLTAMGLAIGPAASPELGGETNYRGQVNSLWLWQNTLGLRVVDQVLKRWSAGVIPLLRPAPPALSNYADALRAIEDSNTYSNFGPVNTRLERDLIELLFQGSGHCVTTCNATLGLMLAIRNAIEDGRPEARYALMPSFTFAAAGQAALWCGLTPLYCDIDPDTWLPSAESEDALLREFAGQIAVIVPNCTFGNTLDLLRYEAIATTTGIPVVVDAAAALGSLDERGLAFGQGSSLPIVFSMHATKPFSTGEGGLLYSADERVIGRLRTMSSFGFGEDRTATMLGLNAKMTEVAALTASLQLAEFPARIAERGQIAQWYCNALQGEWQQQTKCGKRVVRSFESVLLPPELAPHRDEVMQRMRQSGVMTGHYFSPHLAEQPYLRGRSVCPSLPVTEDVASRILSLPAFAGLSAENVTRVVDTLRATTNDVALRHAIGQRAESSLSLTS